MVLKTKQQIIVFRYTDVFFLFIDQRDTSMYIYIYVFSNIPSCKSRKKYFFSLDKSENAIHIIYIYYIYRMCAV